MSLTRNALFVFAALALCGCGESKPPTYSISGRVKVGPKPLEFGAIHFVPDGGPGGPQAANVKDGQYSVANLQAGKYRVTVEAMAAVPTADGTISSDSKLTKPSAPVAVPPKYKAGVPVDVTADNPALDFDLSN